MSFLSPDRPSLTATSILPLKIAGGFDAVWLLVCEPPEDTPGLPPLPRVERLWMDFPGVAPLLAQESKAQGVTLERLDDVPGLAAVVNV